MITEGYKKKGGKNGPPIGPRPEPPKGQEKKNMKREEKEKYFIMLAQSAHTYVITKNSSVSEMVYYDMIYALRKLNYL